MRGAGLGALAAGVSPQGLRDDVRDAVRRLARSPFFLMHTTLSLGVAVALCMLAFSFFNAVHLRGLGVRDPGRLVTLGPRFGFSFPEYRAYRESLGPSADVVASYPTSEWLVSTAGRQMAHGVLVSDNYFDVLGVTPVIGRGFSAGEGGGDGGGDAVVILSYEMWHRLFGSAPSVVGRERVRIGELSCAVIGIAPETFTGSSRGAETDFWMPAAQASGVAWMREEDLLHNREQIGWDVDIRMVGDMSPSVLVARLQAIEHQQARGREHRLRAMPFGALTGVGSGQLKAGTIAVLILAGVLVLLACANTSNLLLTRLLGQRPALAVRIAVGGSRSRLARVLLLEAAAIAGCATLLGAGVAAGIAPLASRVPLPLSLPGRSWASLSLAADGHQLAFAGLVIVIMAFGLGIPAVLFLARLKTTDALAISGASRGSEGRGLMRQALVVAQVSLAVGLLVLGSVLCRSLWKARDVALGFRTADRYVMDVVADRTGATAAESLRRYTQVVVQTLASAPGVRRVSYASSLPLSGDWSLNGMRRTGTADSEDVLLTRFIVGPGFLECLGIPILRGVSLPNATEEEEPVVVISRAAAERLFHDEDPVGRYVQALRGRYRVVGVSGDIKTQQPTEELTPAAFFVAAQHPWAFRSEMSFVVLAHESGAAARSALVSAGRKGDPAVSIAEIYPLRERAERLLRPFTVRAVASAVVALAGLLLALAGIYAHLTFAVRAKTRELGIRSALGATPRRLMGHVLRGALIQVVAGCAVGLVLAAQASKLVASLVYGIAPLDPVSFLGIPAVLGLAALVAAALPAARAARLQPGSALLHE